MRESRFLNSDYYSKEGSEEMKKISEMTKAECEQLLAENCRAYDEWKAKNLKLDMSRGKPGADQLALSEEMLSCVDAGHCIDNTGMDSRNYGGIDGLPEAKKLFEELFNKPADNIILGGNSSLNMMYDTIARAYTHGMCEGCTPWCKEEGLKFLCPSPGYDRHFAITEYFGIELITVPMKEDGPDLDMVEELVKDEKVKGIWCVPKYSNPDGISYSDEVVRRFARLKPAAKDFRIMWDNAYAVHHLYDEDQDEILDILVECEKAGNPDLPLIFASTSKITFPGSGVAMLAASKKNLDFIKKQMAYQTIGPDKINQLRHVRFFGTVDGIKRHMSKQAAILRPKFEAVLELLDKELAPLGIAEYTRPKGGYFISVNLPKGCAKRTVALAKEAGVVLTGAGATFPYGKDPEDRNIRLAPSFPPVAELTMAMELFCVCAKIAALEAAVK